MRASRGNKALQAASASGNEFDRTTGKGEPVSVHGVFRESGPEAVL